MKKVNNLYFFLLLLTGGVGSVTTTYSFWNTTADKKNHTILIGAGETGITIPHFDPNKNYAVGDIFQFANHTWIVTGSWFNTNQFAPNGNLNESYLRPYGPINELTNEWRSYNIYHEGDSVLHNGYEGVVRHDGANSFEPGSNTNSWNRISNEWFKYNTYEIGDEVLYDGTWGRAKATTGNNIPPNFTWAGLPINY